MNWIEVSDGLLINLENVKGVAKDGNRATLYVELSEGLKETSVDMTYDALKSMLLKRASFDRKVDQIIKNTRTLAKSAYTPTP